MRIQLIGSDRENNEEHHLNRENRRPIPFPGRGENNEGRIRIHTEDDIRQELESVRAELAQSKQQLEQKSRALMDAEGENEWLKNELDARDQELLEARRLAERGEEITTEDLEDKDSLIRELQARNRELEEELSHHDRERRENQDSEIQRLREEQDTELQRRREEQEQEMLRLREEKDMELQRLREEQNGEVQHLQKELEIQRREKEELQNALEEFREREKAAEEAGQYRRSVENLKKQIEEAQQEEGRAFEELQEISLRYRQDMKYVEFYEKVPEKKIDGLELFRSQVKKLDEKLSVLLDNGLRKAYLFRGNSLLEELEKNKEQFTDIMEQLQKLVENYEFDGETPEEEDVKTTEEYRREAKEALAELEKTLQNMQAVTGKFLKIKNIIGLTQYNE